MSPALLKTKTTLI